MRLEEILTHNRAFVARRTATPLSGAVTLPLAVVACYDPRLDALLRDALGLAPAEAFLFRVAGALLRPDSNSLRSLANSVFFFGVSEVLVVGHTSCRMAAFSTPDYIASFRARGVPREAFGDRDLRDWAGAIPSPRAGVLRSLDALATAPYLPRDLRISGAVLDDASGALEVVSPVASLAERSVALPSNAPVPGAAAPSAAPGADEDRERAQASSAPPAAEGAPQIAGAPDDLGSSSHEVEQLREFVRLLESAGGWKDELQRARAEIARERNPVRKLALVETFVRRATVNAREVTQSFERLKDDAANRARGFDLDQLVALVLGGTGESVAMTLGFVFVGLLILGVLYAGIAGAMGWLSDLGGGDIHIDASGHLDAGHAAPISGTTVATFVTGFGGGGTIAQYLLNWGTAGSLALATGSGLILAAAAFGALELIFHQTQAGSEFTVGDVVGHDAEVITAIPQGATGEVAYLAKGQRELSAARSVDGSPVAKGTIVVIEKVLGATMFVREKR